MEESKLALAQFLGVGEDELNEVHYRYRRSDGMYETSNGEEYLVYSDYDDAFEDAKESFLQVCEDCGWDFGKNSSLDFYINEHIKDDFFEDIYRESQEYYAYNIASENDGTYGNRLVQECYDADIIGDEDFEEDENGDPIYTECLKDEDELVSLYTDYLVDSVDDYFEEVSFNWGKKEALELAIKNGAINEDALAQDVIEDCGVANELASYDGCENEEEYEGTTYYIYRTN